MNGHGAFLVCMVMGSSINCNMGDRYMVHCFSLFDVTKWPFFTLSKIYLLSPSFG